MKWNIFFKNTVVVAMVSNALSRYHFRCFISTISGNVNLFRLAFLLFFFFIPVIYVSLNAEPVSKDEVLNACKGWLNVFSKPLNSNLTGDVASVNEFNDSSGRTLYFVVNFKPSGYVVFSADNMIQPVVAFSDSGSISPNEKNPFSEIIQDDMKERLKKVLKIQAGLNKNGFEMSLNSPQMDNMKKWKSFQAYSNKEPLDSGVDLVDEVWVVPFTSTVWSQTTVLGNACYNYYTPTGLDANNHIIWDSGNPNNYPSGCVAAAFAQLLKFYKRSEDLNASKEFIISCDNIEEKRHLLGSDGKGRAYDWNMMPDDLTNSTEQQRRAVGGLFYDCGLTLGMKYYKPGASAITSDIARALKDDFAFRNAIYASNNYLKPNEMLNHIPEMINPNLDAGLPVILGLKRSPKAGHAVVCDGYGYNAGTSFHHLNFGWGGVATAWYHLPYIDSSPSWVYDRIKTTIYNIFVDGVGEIISGRVVDSLGRPVKGLVVSGANLRDVTDDKGIYALVGVPSNTDVTVVCDGADPLRVRTRKSVSGYEANYSVGNLWGVDFIIGTSSEKYHLTVNEGSGTGEYPERKKVEIKADVPLGKVFRIWSGDTVYLDNPAAAKTTVLMPKRQLSVTATFMDAPAKSYSIRGSLAGSMCSGVTILLTGDGLARSVRTLNDGSFEFNALGNGVFNISVALGGYAVSPNKQCVTINGNDVDNVTFRVNGNSLSNQVPIGQDDSYRVVEGDYINIAPNQGVLRNDGDFDNDTLVAVLVRYVAHGNLIFKSDGSFVYYPAITSGTDSFTYTAYDGIANSNLVTVNIFVLPKDQIVTTAFDDEYVTNPQTQLSVDFDHGVFLNDMPLGLHKGAVLIQTVKHGTLRLHDDGSFTYIPFAGYLEDSFKYKISSTPNSNIANVIITISPKRVTLGSILSVKNSEVPELIGVKFRKIPKLYAIDSNGSKYNLKKCRKFLRDNTVFGTWSKNIPLFNKNILKSNYESFLENGTHLREMDLTLAIKTKDFNGNKIDKPVKNFKLVTPVFERFENTNGEAVVSATTGEKIMVYGKFFGVKIPAIALVNKEKWIKCKVDKSSLKFTSANDRASCMDIFTGKSFFSFFVPKKNIEPGIYSVVIYNKIGVASISSLNEFNKGNLPSLLIIK